MFGVNVEDTYVRKVWLTLISGSFLIFEKGASDLADFDPKVLPANKHKVIIDGMLA